jgi:hypothetical protein
VLTVACVLKSGGIYNASWVERLRAGVARHLPTDHRFVCLSDVDVPCERIPLEHDWAGWWSKIELFKIEGPVLFFDLDTLIVGDLADVAAEALKWPLVTLQDFYRPSGLGSGVMAWNGQAGGVEFIYQKFAVSPSLFMASVVGGDQAFIEFAVIRAKVQRWQAVLPGQFVSYKADNCVTAAPKDSRVLCFHGKPKQSDLVGSWVYDTWCAAA